MSSSLQGTGPEASATARLRVSGVSVTFGRNRVLRDVSLDVAPGEIHALIGQNGSGKSTLAKVLTGLYSPDAGASVDVDGEPLHLPVRPLESRERGVAVVHQSLGLVPQMSVLENLRVGRLQATRFTRRIQWKKERAAALEVFERLERPVPLDALVGSLSEEDRASVAIARALQDATAGRGIIIFDESTRALSRQSLEHFYRVLDGVIASGTSALLITHRLEEVIDAADRVSVLRDGDLVASGVEVKGRTAHDLAELMLGRTIAAIQPGAGHARTGERPLIEVSALTSARLSGVEVSVAPGEIVGITGLADSGYHELPYVLAGVQRANAGSVVIDGVPLELARLTPARAIDAGVALVPSDREGSAIAFELSVAENAALPRSAAHGARLATIPRRAEREELGPWFDRLELRPRDTSRAVGTFSGGNQQKVVLAKWLARHPRVLVLHEPTQAVDVGARAIIVAAIKDAAAQGCAVLVASGDESELSLLCDRVLVFRDGAVAAELAGPQSPDDIVSAIFLTTDRQRLRADR